LTDYQKWVNFEDDEPEEQKQAKEMLKSICAPKTIARNDRSFRGALLRNW
jgi:hypothetical protein